MKIRTGYILHFFTIFLVVVIFSDLAMAQRSRREEPKVKPFRSFLGKFTVSGSIGLGRTWHVHKVEGLGVIQNPGTAPLLFDASGPVTNPIQFGVANWVNNPTSVQDITVDTSSFYFSTDSIPVKFKAKGLNIPINLMVHYTFDRYRIGGGWSFEPYRIGKYHSNVYEDKIEPFNVNFNLSYYTRWYFMLGGEVIKTRRYMLVVDAKVGSYKLQKKHFNAELIEKGIFFNLGARMEKSLSEYVKIYIRPSLEFKNYKISFPEAPQSLTHHLPAFYTSIGLSWRLPDRRKCPISNCHTQINHYHGSKLYRSRMHPFWKWQDPDYGQNYPRLHKDKRKNKRKINPY
ncbi:MAG: hypothetical protein ABFS32_07030 [Bacteroidota bacterium]